ncbi:MAG TPA: hypothetical protein VGD21_15830 [Lysobacter sp.]
MKYISILLLTIAALYTSTASASNCTGTLIDYKRAYYRGEKVGELQLYYNSSTGNNCATFFHSGSTWGKKLFTSVEVYVCKPSKYGNCGVWQWSPWWSRDDGWYLYRAGPVQVYGRDRCVQAMGYLDIAGATGADGVAVSGIHC